VVCSSPRRPRGGGRRGATAPLGGKAAEAGRALGAPSVRVAAAPSQPEDNERRGARPLAVRRRPPGRRGTVRGGNRHPMGGRRRPTQPVRGRIARGGQCMDAPPWPGPPRLGVIVGPRDQLGRQTPRLPRAAAVRAKRAGEPHWGTPSADGPRVGCPLGAGVDPYT